MAASGRGRSGGSGESGESGQSGGTGAPRAKGASRGLAGLDPAHRALLEQRLLGQQNFGLAIVAGSVAAVAGAGAWAAVTVASGYELGLVAVVLGWAVGMAVRVAGKGVTPAFAVLGGSLAFVACGLGNLLTATALVARHAGVPIAQALGHLDVESSRRLLVAFSSPMDLLFYAIAVYEGYRLARRPVGRAEIQAILAGPSTPAS